MMTSGILVVDKPAGMTSAAVVARVKRRTQAKKVGHTGTLDPFATGVLICCINKATRLAGFLLKGPKTYDALMHLGVTTDTQDATGTVTHQTDGDPDISADRLTEVFGRYRGISRQQPPVYSALKVNGVPLYKLARAGKAVQKPPRQIEITDLRITHIRMPFVRFTVSCSAGTYIRTLCADIGGDLGCGAHLKELRRTASGGFSIDQAISLDDFEKLAEAGKWTDTLTRMADALKDIPRYAVSGAIVNKIKNGVLLTPEDLNKNIVQTKGLIQITDSQHNLLAILDHKNESQIFSYCCVLI